MPKKKLVLKSHGPLAIPDGDVMIQGLKEDPRQALWEDIWIYYWDKRKRKVHAPCFISKTDLIHNIDLKFKYPPKIGDLIFDWIPEEGIVDRNYLQDWIEWQWDEFEHYTEIKEIVEHNGFYFERLENYDTIYSNEEWITREIVETLIKKCYFPGKDNLKFNWQRTSILIMPT